MSHLWRYGCPECGSVQVMRRIEPDHPNSIADKRYRCDQCGVSFDRKVDRKTGGLVA